MPYCERCGKELSDERPKPPSTFGLANAVRGEAPILPSTYGLVHVCHVGNLHPRELRSSVRRSAKLGEGRSSGMGGGHCTLNDGTTGDFMLGTAAGKL
jgi:hypothetical protein